MNRRLVMFAFVGAILAIAGCQDSAPLSPAVDMGDVGPVLAAAPGISVTFDMDLGPALAVNPDCDRQVASGILLIHMCEFRGSMTGDIWDPTWGSVVLIVTGRQDSEGNGRGYGHVTLTGTWDGVLTGTFEGNAAIKWTEWLGEGRLHARGTAGDFVGMQMWGDFLEQEDPPGNFVVTVTGIIR